MGAHHVAISDPSSVTTGLNADVWIKHRENVETVLQSEMFEGVADRMPLEIDAGEGVDSGCMAPFNKEQGMAALAKTGRYMCAINLLWVDVYYTASGAVPILWASVEEIQKSYFSKPAGFMKLPIEIGVFAGQVEKGQFGEFGKWPRVSSEEVVMAWFAAVAADITANKAPSTLKKWLDHLLSTPAAFHLVKGDMAWFMEQRREDMSTNATLARTTVQRIFDINNRRMQIGAKATPHQVLALYDAHLTTSEQSEKIAITFVERAFTLWDRALSKPKIQEVVLAQEALRQKSLFAHSTKLHLLVQKARTDDNIAFVFQLLHDQYLSGILVADMMGTQALEGKQSGSNGKGLVDVWVFKRTLRNYFLDEYMPNKQIPQEIKTTIREVCTDFKSFRAKVGYRNSKVLPDLTWKAGWPTSAELMLGLIEDPPLINSPSPTPWSCCYVFPIPLDTAFQGIARRRTQPTLGPVQLCTLDQKVGARADATRGDFSIWRPSLGQVVSLPWSGGASSGPCLLLRSPQRGGARRGGRK